MFYKVYSYIICSLYTFLNNAKYIQNLKNNPNLNMTELWTKTESLFNVANSPNQKLYSGILSYMGGNAWLNMKLSFGEILHGRDKEIFDSINVAVQNVEPLSYPITLFHGFETFTNYNENKWNKNDIISVPEFLSKTPSFDVANRFARGQSYKFNRKFLVVEYPIGSKHIGLDIRNPKDLGGHTEFNEEYEYLSHSNEQLKLINIIREIEFFHINTFYICKPYINPCIKISTTKIIDGPIIL